MPPPGLDRPSIGAISDDGLPIVLHLPSRGVTWLACRDERARPEDLHVPAMWNGMVDFRCLGHILAFQAPLTEWMDAELIPTQAAPSGRSIETAIALGFL